MLHVDLFVHNVLCVFDRWIGSNDFFRLRLVSIVVFLLLQSFILVFIEFLISFVFIRLHDLFKFFGRLAHHEYCHVRLNPNTRFFYWVLQRHRLRITKGRLNSYVLLPLKSFKAVCGIFDKIWNDLNICWLNFCHKSAYFWEKLELFVKKYLLNLFKRFIDHVVLCFRFPQVFI